MLSKVNDLIEFSSRRLSLEGIDFASALHKEVNNSVAYLPEPAGKDHYQTPLETFALGTGDCEDFAILYFVGMRIHGMPIGQVRIAYEPRRPDREAHMVCLFFTNGVWNALDNTREAGVVRQGVSVGPGKFTYTADESGIRAGVNVPTSHFNHAEWKRVLDVLANNVSPIFGQGIGWEE